MLSVAEQIEELKNNFNVEETGSGKVKIFLFVSNDWNFELEVDLNPLAEGKKPKFGFEKKIKDALGNINKILETLKNWNEDSKISDVIYELEDQLITTSTAKFTVMDEIYVLVGNYGPRATFEGKVAKVKLIDIRKNEYLITLDATEYPKLNLKFPGKLSERIGEPEDLRFVQRWGGHLFELVGELEYRLNLYERFNFEFQVLNKFSEYVVKESLSFNPATGYISGDLEKDGTRIELDLDYMTGYPELCPRAIVNVRPDNPQMQQRVNDILSDVAENWAPSKIFMRTIDKISKEVFGTAMVRDLKSNKPLTGDTGSCEKCGGVFLNSSMKGDKFRCEYCFFGDIHRKEEKLIDDLLGKFE